MAEFKKGFSEEIVILVIFGDYDVVEDEDDLYLKHMS